MASIGKIEHAPERRVGIGLGDLKKRKIRRVWGGQREFVNGRNDAGVHDRPFQISRCLATDNSRAAWSSMPWI